MAYHQHHRLITQHPHLLPVLIEELCTQPLWTFVDARSFQAVDGEADFSIPSVGTTTLLGRSFEAIPVFSSKECALRTLATSEGIPHHQIYLACVDSGRELLSTLAKESKPLVFDRGQSVNVVIPADDWLPLMESHGRVEEITNLFQAADCCFSGVDEDAFPQWRERLTCFLLGVAPVTAAWLLWVNSMDNYGSPRLSVVIACAQMDIGMRIRSALPMLAHGLDLPLLDCTLLAADSALVQELSAGVASFFNEALRQAMAIASCPSNA